WGVAAWEASAGLDEDENIYALFRTKSALEWVGQEWRGDTLMDLIEQFEIDRRNHLVENLGRSSPNPRILPLRSVLMCLKDI
ncbi:MAG: hypothetical protein M3R61_18020, partial [Chloroflexota bacterium]|nr:hypothetical protein [Chloroflexota bacterium]